MTSRDPTILATHGICLPDFARSRGIDLDASLKALGIPPGSFEDYGSRLPLETFAALLGIMAGAARDDCIGLSYADSFNLGDIGSFGFAMLNAPTVGSALEVYGRFQALVAGTAYFSLDVSDSSCAVEWRYASLMASTVHYVDFRIAMICKMMERLTAGRWEIHALALVRPPPQSTARHRQLFRNVRFGGAFNRLTFSAGGLGQPVPGADPRIFRLMLQNCEDSLAALERKKDVHEEVRDVILALLPKRQATLSEVSCELGLSERALQRRLADGNMTFEHVLESTRRELAEHLLTQSETSIAEISYLCGYAAASAFTRAARNWFDMPPLAFRRRSSLQLSANPNW